MLVRISSTSRNPIEGHFAALAGERAFSSEFKYRRGTEIFGEGEEPDYVYQIISGAVRTYKLLADGRRQINSFHLSGDMFGFENGRAHRFSAEALVETNVRIMRQRSLPDTLEGETTAEPIFFASSRKACDTPKTTCFYWAGKRLSRGSQPSFSKWTSGRIIRACWYFR